jgi:hypothetical protein
MARWSIVWIWFRHEVIQSAHGLLAWNDFELYARNAIHGGFMARTDASITQLDPFAKRAKAIGAMQALNSSCSEICDHYGATEFSVAHRKGRILFR